MLISIALVLAFMYWARVIVIPVALSILITFLLVPTVNWLEKIYIPRVLAVILMTVISLSLFLGATYAITKQIDSLVDSYPQYEDNITAKISQINEQGSSGLFDKFHSVAERLYEQLEQAQKDSKIQKISSSGSQEASHAQPVKIVEDSPFHFSALWGIAGPVLEPLANIGLVIVLIIFMLINREDLRDRFIALVGIGQMTDTTRALEDAGDRISRYLLIQLFINCCYGMAVGIGLWLIGVPYFILWGSFAALLRYIPYLGAWLSALLPIALSLLISPDWSIALMVIALFLMLELVTNMIAEPMLYGRGIGVSQAALLVTVAFWAWLWGPIGLILASPLTVCLAVLGRHVPFLKFLDILLGDRPTLSSSQRYYQRLLAKDEDEASDIIERYIEDDSMVHAFDKIIIPALSLARADLRSGKLDELSHKEMVELSGSILEDQRSEMYVIESKEKKTEKESNDGATSPLPVTSVLAVPARDSTDKLLVDALSMLLDPSRFEIHASPGGIVYDILADVKRRTPDVLVILSVPPGGVAHVRHICKRITARFPDLRIVVGRLGLYEEDQEENRRRLSEVGADYIVFSLADVVSELNKLSTLD
ncbi:ABC transporter permease [Nitrosomonas sp. PY1]|uniref:AI-2E family transporter n=1 Tax=Nitrosomonas sp. PY1 TaxID=1803906 RepID=UPI001FC89DDA|nr:AI-2E family transporter [Nitrosomonas sp. PY1]GKS69521.1 ABC transporter permease [Nitrosomonas sp. PY1]